MTTRILTIQETDDPRLALVTREYLSLLGPVQVVCIQASDSVQREYVEQEAA